MLPTAVSREAWRLIEVHDPFGGTREVVDAQEVGRCNGVIPRPSLFGLARPVLKTTPNIACSRTSAGAIMSRRG
jgi:hypothetical protein